MTDKEKVINTLEHCIYECFDECPYEYGGAVTLEYCRSDLMRDALELLKEQQEPTVPEQQEPIAPKQQEETHMWTVCGNCSQHLISKWMYCPYCGRKVKWDD